MLVVAVVGTALAFVEVRTSDVARRGDLRIAATPSAPSMQEVIAVLPAPGSIVCSRPKIQVALRLRFGVAKGWGA